jgi:hypothetical protein
MKRLACVVAVLVLGITPSALTQSQQSPPASFAFTTFDALFTGVLNTENNGINDLGISVGDYCTDNIGNNCHGYRRSANGGFTQIEPLGAGYSIASSINTNGVIVGVYAAPGIGLHCFVFSAGIYTTIDVPSSAPGPFFGGFATQCRGINDQDQIVGAYNTPPPAGSPPGTPPSRHGFLLSGSTFTGGVFIPGVFIPINVPNASPTDPTRINNLGQIVGRYRNQSGFHGFLLDAATLANPIPAVTSIDFPGATETVLSPGGINDKGDIVGTYRNATNYLFGFIVTTKSSQNTPGPPPPTAYHQIVLPGPGQNVGTVPSLLDLDWASSTNGINDRDQISGEYWGIENFVSPASGIHVHGFVTAPKRDFEVTGSALIPNANPSSITGVFEGHPVGEGSFTLENISSPTPLPLFGLFVFCGSFGGSFPPHLVLTASTGDQVFVDLLVTVCQTASPPVPSSAVISGIYRITGGTGKFGGMSGSGFVTGTAEFPAVPSTMTPGTLTITLEGSITR